MKLEALSKYLPFEIVTTMQENSIVIIQESEEMELQEIAPFVLLTIRGLSWGIRSERGINGMRRSRRRVYVLCRCGES
jgi:hypothetical protein